MAQENKSKVSILTNGIIKENPVLAASLLFQAQNRTIPRL